MPDSAQADSERHEPLRSNPYTSPRFPTITIASYPSFPLLLQAPESKIPTCDAS